MSSECALQETTMELFPAMRWGWLNGWVLPSVLLLVFGALLSGFSREIVTKLYDRSGWRPYQRVGSTLSKLGALACFVLFIGSPLKTGIIYLSAEIVLDCPLALALYCIYESASTGQTLPPGHEP